MNTSTPTTRPGVTDEAWFVVRISTKEIVEGPLTKGKATNKWKKIINFGDPIKGHNDWVVCWSPATVFDSDDHLSEIAAARRENRESAPETKRWANRRAMKGAGFKVSA